MERSAYNLLEGMEKTWWYRGRTQAVRAVLAKTKTKELEAALDFGAGYGGMENALTNVSKIVDAFEPDEAARSAASSRGYHEIFADEESAFKNQYDLIGLFDVLEHIEDDKGFLLRAHGGLSPKGKLVITVPAFMKLWSTHDVEHHHFRRYTTTSLRKLLLENGYAVEYSSYWNCALLIPAAVMRFFGKSGEDGLTPPVFINNLLLAWLSFEASILRYIPLPFGLSVVVVAYRK
jgi:SAM-dependent methyltransferase